MDTQASSQNEAQKDAIDEKVVELINEAIVSTNDTEKVKSLQQVQSLVIHHNLIDNFLDEVIGFQSDKSEKVRRFVVEFIEISCKKDPDFFPKLIVNLALLLNDSNPNVVKRTIQSLTSLFRVFLKWTIKCTANINSQTMEEAESALEEWNSMKLTVCSLIETTENEGIKTQCIKFMETIVIVQSEPDQWTTIAIPSAGDQDDVNIKTLSSSKSFNEQLLAEESLAVFDQLMTLLATAHISSVNLIACISSLVLIARSRSVLYMGKVIEALVSLHANLPPTLSQSQLSSVNKHFKVQLSTLLKHPLAATTSHFQSSIVELLTDLGVSHSDINKCLNEVKKRGIKFEVIDVKAKRIKLEAAAEPEQAPRRRSSSDFIPPKITRMEANAAVEITAAEVKGLLEVTENVTDLVLVSLLTLPDSMPPHFPASYQALAARQQTHNDMLTLIAHSLSQQWTAAGFGRGIEEVVKKHLPPSVDEQLAAKIVSAVASGIASELKRQESSSKTPMSSSKSPSASKVKLIPTTGTKTSTKVKPLNWAELTKELDEDTNNKMIISAIERILNKENERQMMSTDQFDSRSAILAHLTAIYNNYVSLSSMVEVTQLIVDYALADLRSRSDILFSIIYNQYLIWKKSKDDLDLANYDKCLLMVLNGISSSTEIRDRDNYLTKFFLESPFLTDNCLQFLKFFILSPSENSSVSMAAGFSILESLIQKRVNLRPQLIACLTSLTINVTSPEVRSTALKSLQKIHESFGPEIKDAIGAFAKDILQKLTEEKPPSDLFPNRNEWDEEMMKVCFQPYLTLLPNSHKLIHDLAVTYVATPAVIKRVILRNLDLAVKGIGMTSPELLLLVETCPKGSETLVTRMIHILTDRTTPSPELVSRVRDLYHKRVADVRFLVPVLNGLTKKEVVSALPKLIKLKYPETVREVFNRLLGVHHASSDSSSNFQSPLSPTELLVALHDIDEKKCDMKTVIKATSLCFAEKNIYTSEVLAGVIQLLMGRSVLPTLFMRTVIQSLTLYPKLMGFIMGVLQRLIPKQVWKQKKVWEGFIKCCQQTRPQSFSVLLQLPLPQLKSVFVTCPELKLSLQQHFDTCSDVQRSHVSSSYLDVIYSSDTPVEEMETNAPKEVEVQLPDSSAEAVVKTENVDVEMENE